MTKLNETTAGLLLILLAVAGTGWGKLPGRAKRRGGYSGTARCVRRW